MYTVEIRHHCKTYTRGDVDADFQLIESKNFKTRTAGKEYIENKLKYKSNVRKTWHKGDEPSYCYWFTGESWHNECTGEMEDEYYQYKLMKTKVN